MSLTGTRFVKQTAVSTSVPARPITPHRSTRHVQRKQTHQNQLAAVATSWPNRIVSPSYSRHSQLTAAAAPNSAETADDARGFAVAMAKIADATKATDLSVLHVAPLVSWTSYMVICTVMSRPQLLAVLARMEDAARDDWDRVKQNSAGSSQWEVMDFGDVVVHVFTAEQREHYDLDGFYAAAEEVPLSIAEDWERASGSGVEQSSRQRSAVANAVWSKNLLSI